MNIKTSDFFYDLPEHLIAQYPTSKRDESKLMVLNPKTKSVAHTKFKNIIDFFKKGDVLVLNDTKVLPARLYGKKEGSGIDCEILLLKKIENKRWEALVKPGRRLKEGAVIHFAPNFSCKVIQVSNDGNRILEFCHTGIFEEKLEELGQMPLPPYIHQKLEEKDRYQTVYAEHRGSAAAPTAGLHFTHELLNSLIDKGVELVYLTLHVGLGTFRPVQVENIENHIMHSESFSISELSATKINKAILEERRIIAVGTTTTRVLETQAQINQEGQYYLKAGQGETNIFIHPGKKMRIVDALITNFHLPNSTLLMLVSTLAGRKFILEAYADAVKNDYRFFSFGDAMLILDNITK